MVLHSNEPSARRWFLRVNRSVARTALALNRR